MAFFEVVPVSQIVFNVGAAIALGAVVAGIAVNTRRFADRKAMVVKWERTALFVGLALMATGYLLLPAR